MHHIAFLSILDTIFSLASGALLQSPGLCPHTPPGSAPGPFKPAAFPIPPDVARELYYKQMFDSKMNTAKKLWDNLNVVCSFKTKKSGNNVNKLVMDDQTLVDSYEISNGFNKYFSNIGQTLAKKFNKDSNMNFSYYLNNPKKDSMFCEPLEAEELCKLIINLNVKKVSRA